VTGIGVEGENVYVSSVDGVVRQIAPVQRVYCEIPKPKVVSSLTAYRLLVLESDDKEKVMVVSGDSGNLYCIDLSQEKGEPVLIG
jgi:hypothetical protein